MATMTATSTLRAAGPVQADIVTRIGNFFGALRAGYTAASDYEQLQHLSDDALARKGLTRADAMRMVMERNFG